MNIVCNKNEFAMLVRNCQRNEGECEGCLFTSVCSGAGCVEDGDIMSYIEDICEVVVDG